MCCTRLTRAFTLIEILTVVLILGIAGAVLVPQMGSRDDLRATSAAREVMADLMFAQNRAISTQLKHYVEFNGNTYTLYSRPDDLSPLAVIQHPVTREDYVQKFAVKGTALESVTIGTVSFGGKVYLGFDEFGAPFAYDPNLDTIAALTSPGTIPLKSGSYSITINVEPYTGNISTP